MDGKSVKPTKLGKDGAFGKCEEETTESMIRKGKSRKIRSKSSASPAEGADIAEPQEKDFTINLITDQSKNGEKSFKTYNRGQSKILGENGLSSIVKTPPSGKGKTLASSDQTAMHSSKRQRTQIPDSSSGNGIFLKSTVQDLPDGISANGSGSVEQAVVSPAVVEGHRGEVIDSNSVLETVKKAASVEPNDRLNCLVTKKDEYDNLLNQLKEHENQIMEHNCEKMKILEEIANLDEKIKELQEKRDLVFSMRADMDNKLSCLELKLKSAAEEMDKFSAFKEAAAFP